VDIDGSRGRLTDHIGVGVLTRLLHRDLVDEVLLSTGRVEQRVRLLPARVVVYFVLGLCLFCGENYEEVMRRMAQGLRFMGNWSDRWRVPTAGALTRARERLGVEPLRELFERVAVPMAEPGTRRAWLRNFRLMSIDGTLLDVPDTAANDEKYGRSGNDIADAPFPQVRLVALVECGTRAIVGANFGAYRVSENELSDDVRQFCEPGMLIIADRNFFGHQRWRDFCETGADLLWRVQENVLLPCYEVYPDGSYLSILATQNQRQTAARRSVKTGKEVLPEGQPVRVVEYMITNRTETTETICLITTILDVEEATAHELAQAYHDRWQIETAIGEIKTTLLGSGRTLRSQSPQLIEQEIWALLLTHYAISELRREAADDIEEDIDRVSFLKSLRIIRRHIASQAAFSPSPPTGIDS
jgi:hypothetical protein